MYFHTYISHLHVSLKDRPYSGKVDVHYDLFMMEDKVENTNSLLEFTA